MTAECEHAKSDMTPCFRKDGPMALSSGNTIVCIGCGLSPMALLQELGLQAVNAWQSGEKPEDYSELIEQCLNCFVGAADASDKETP